MRFFTLLAAFATLAATSATIKNCNTSSLFQITQLALVPDPPVAGESVAMQLVFTNPGAPIDNGTVLSTVTLNYVPFPTSVSLLCENTACPISTGSQDRSTKSVWPSSVTGHVTTKLEWQTGSDTLLCIHTDFTVASESLWSTLLRGWQGGVRRMLGMLGV
jgi:hypothetical protein